ncbi:MAG: CAP domain-containing protein [Paracoccaceae bacterium]
MTKPHFFAALLLCVAALAPQSASARSCDLPANMGELQAAVVADVNAQRAASGLPALRLNSALVKAAQSHACDNAKRQSTSHVSSDGSQLRQRLRRAGYSFAVANENTGRGFGSPGQAVDWWMNSPHHRDNILMRGTQDIGVGIAFSDAPESRLHWVINMGASR